MANIRDLAWLEAMPPDVQQQPLSRRQHAHGYRDNYVATAPVGTFPLGASSQGAVDLVGNVSEWTWEAFERGGDYQKFAHWAGELGLDNHPYFSWGLYVSKPSWPGERAARVGFRCVWSKHAPAVAKPIDDRFERPSEAEARLRKQFHEAHKADKFTVISHGYRITQPTSSATGTVLVPGDNPLVWLKGYLYPKQEELAQCFAPLLSGDARQTYFAWHTELEPLVTLQPTQAATSALAAATARLQKGTSDCTQVRPSGPPKQPCDQARQDAVLECLFATAPPIEAPLCQAKPMKLSFTLEAPPFAQ